jgi:apolipoprotein N-acyltransferase
LKFALLLPGQASALLPGVRLASIGVYGLGFIYLFLSALAVGPNRFPRALGAVGLSLAGVLMYLPILPTSEGNLNVAGVQMEFWEEADIAAELNRLATDHPEAELLVLSEYTFGGPVPESVRNVLRTHGKYLIAGGKEACEGGYYNTAFVVGPDGGDLFKQAKSVPVQFMVDGLPAPERRVWESPWGKIGIAICYDACFAEVMDEFVRQGARALIIPTMDVKSWGRFERGMIHGRAPPIRSAEYGIPSFGVWSSGRSQLIDRHGRIVATAGYPGQGETISGTLDLSQGGHIPIDRKLAWASICGTLLFVIYLLVQRVWSWWRRSRRKVQVRSPATG